MQSSSLFLRSCTTLITIVFCYASTSFAATTTSSSYALQTAYSGSNFFSGFSFFTDADPTHGYVTYVNKSTAQNMGLITGQDGSPVRIGVDYTNKYDVNGAGRASVRLTSNQVYNHGLFIADLANMPGGVCGTWPALWTLGPNWPYGGEIDIIEGVNTQSQALTSLHTGGTCNVPGSGSVETGSVQATNCTYDTKTGANSAGCGVLSTDTTSFGSNFNSNSGGVYAMQWTSTAIKTWYFKRSAIPSDITAGTPNPAGWGSPYVDFEGGCNFDANFQNHQIVLDTTFCGDWAGSVWGDTCASSTGVSSCSSYVANNPAAFKNMYWSINSIKVYQVSSVTSSSSTTTTTTSSTTTSSSVTTTKSSSTSASTTSSSISSTPTTTTSSSTTSIRTSSSTTPATTSSSTTPAKTSSSTTPVTTSSSTTSAVTSSSSVPTTSSVSVAPTTTTSTTSSKTTTVATTSSSTLATSVITTASSSSTNAVTTTTSTTTAVTRMPLRSISSSTSSATTSTAAPKLARGNGYKHRWQYEGHGHRAHW